MKGFVLILIFMSTLLPALLRLYAPKIEEYSQRPAIDFYKIISKHDCYVTTLGFKSYAQYYYTKVSPPINSNCYDNNWLKTGAIDKPVYFVTHVGYSQDNITPSMQFLYSKGGFEFYKRDTIRN